MQNRIWLCCLVFLVAAIKGNSQNTMPLESVIKEVLTNNFDVQSAKVDVAIANNSATKGNAGLLPNVSANGNAGYSRNNTDLTFAGNIPPANVDGAENTNYGASLGLNYNLFQGFANLRTYDKLKLSENLNETQLRLTIENAVITVIGLYLDLAKLQEDQRALEETIGISLIRLQRAELAEEFGTSRSLDRLNAKVDLHQDSVNLLSLQNQKQAIQRQLNYLMGKAITAEVEASTEVSAFTDLTLENILSEAKQNSTVLALADLQRDMAGIDQKLAQANQYPSISMSTSYGFNGSQNGAGIILEQKNIGFSAGVTVSIPIFSGGRTKIAIENAEYRMEKNDIVKQKNALEIEKQVYDFWYNYQFYTQLLNIENTNVKTAELGLQRAENAYKLGQITSIEFRQAQLNLLASKNRVNAAKYNLKKAEYQLIRLKGDLVK